MRHTADILTSARALAVALVALVALTACGSQAPQAPVPAPSVSGVAQGVPADKAAGVCVDGTRSSNASYAPRFVKVVAGAVGAWASPVAKAQQISAPARGAIEFVMRSVTTDSISTDGATTPITIPAVPGLAPRPTPGSKDFDNTLRTWLDTEADWKTAASAAANQAADAKTAALHFAVQRKTTSGIWSCLSALASQLAVSGPNARLVEITDAKNNAAVVDLRLRGDAVLLVTICPAKGSTACPSRFSDAKSMLLKHGASSVALVRADAVTPATVLNFWRSGT